MTGCEELALYPNEITAVPPERDFSHLTCPQLEAEGIRLTESYEQMRYTMKPNTRNRYAELNGETYAVNDAIRVQGCKLASVQIPGRWGHHEYRGSPE
jgi:hypothetical protein